MSENFEKILNAIPHNDNICLFPLRLETHFRGAGRAKKLCVRIIPDEIILDYYKDGLNQEEIEDGKKFWMQWYIASGSEDREYDAWLALCAKHPTPRAAWICRKTILQNVNLYRRSLDDRPYPHMSEIEAKCESIWSTLGCFSIDERGITVNSSVFENSAKIAFDSIAADLNSIDGSLKIDDGIVDYLYDSIFAVVHNLEDRVKDYFSFYDKYPDLKNNAGGNQIFEKDYSALKDLSSRLNTFIERYKNSRVSLVNLIDELKEKMEKSDEFVDCNVLPKKDFEIPEATMLPERFIFVGETNDGAEIRAESKPVSSKIKLSIDPDKASEYSVDDKGLNVDESIKWMLDYSAAEEAGMAITVDVPNVTGFKYIYVFGIKPKSDEDLLSNLFNGHNYLGDGLRLLNPRTPTNIVDGEVPIDDEDAEKRIRYKIDTDSDIGKIQLLIRKPNNDAQNISDLLYGSYSECWKHVVNFDNTSESKTRCAYGALWNAVFPSTTEEEEKRKKKGLDNDLIDFVGSFFTDFVRATGSVPAIKVGSMPYGILPVCDYEKLHEELKNSSLPQGPMVGKLLGDLLTLKAKWDQMSKSVQNPTTLKGINAEKAYLEMAGQTPYSISFIERKEISSPLIEANIPQISGKDSIFNSFFNKKLNVGQPIRDTDDIFDISTSSLVNVLIGNGFENNDAINYVSEFIDLFTFRLDAWFNGVVSYVLRNNRSGGVLGGVPGVRYNQLTQIGAYGWVFDLNEKTAASNEDQDHFIVAPSLQHALSAAVLRSAYLKSKASEKDSHVCVNLSSMRARQALRLVDGVRSGMSMSVILGCDLERYLHDAQNYGEKDHPAEMDRFIYPLRKLFPQVINIDAEDSKAEAYAMHVVNGEALLETIINHEDWTWSCPVHEWLEEHFYDKKMSWLRDDELKMDEIQKPVFFNIIERLMDSYDALNDLLLSEGVHRLVMGDQSSFDAIGKFMADGEGGLPDPEILKTPSEHVVVSHKAGMILPQFEQPSNEKEILKTKALRLAEPGVDSWVESLVGGMDKICFFVKSADGVVEECTLEKAGVSASEYLYLSSYPATFMNYLETRLCLNAENAYTGKITILESADEAGVSCSEGHLSLEEDALRIQTIRSLLKNGHGMLSSDWNTDVQEDKDDEDSVDKVDLASRCANLIVKAKKLLNDLNKWIVPNSIVDAVSNERALKGELNDDFVDLAYGYLCDCVEFGMVNSFTGFNPNAYMDKLDKVLQDKEREQSLVVQEDLFCMVSSAYDELQKRIAECSASVGLTKNEIEKSSFENIIEAIQNLTLKNVKVFPKFKLQYKNLEFGIIDKKPSEKDYSFKKDENVKLDDFIKNGLKNFVDEASFDQWQDEVSEVRDGMKNLHNLTMAQTALEGKSMSVSIFQTTNVMVQNSQKEHKTELKGLMGYWLGLPVDDEGKLRDVDSLVLYNAEDYQSQNSIAGFIFDGWLEYIPYKKHNAGLVFHCDRPDAEAPQTILIAVNPGNSVWNSESMIKILDTTRQMMMNRAVDPDLIYNDPELSRMFPLFGKEFV
jgi:hypothetical protein